MSAESLSMKDFGKAETDLLISEAVAMPDATLGERARHIVENGTKAAKDYQQSEAIYEMFKWANKTRPSLFAKLFSAMETGDDATARSTAQTIARLWMATAEGGAS